MISIFIYSFLSKSFGLYKGGGGGGQSFRMDSNEFLCLTCGCGSSYWSNR